MDSVSAPQSQSGRRLYLVGTGGQGVLTAARLLCRSLVELGHDVVSGQLHGMAQRGGSVQSSVMIDCGISPVIASGAADYVLGFEPLETARALPLMSSRTVVYVNTVPVVPYTVGQRSVLKGEGAAYPDEKTLLDAIGAVTRHTFPFDATERALAAGSARALNMIMLGCLVGSEALPCSADGFWKTVVSGTPPVLRDVNGKAFFSGVEMGRTFRDGEGQP